MSNFRFDDDLNIRLVRGIEQGYSDYAELRREKRKQLLVSGAYSWVKGNHIEDQVARELQEIGIQFEREKAGYSWEYLSFSNPGEKHLFLIKNANIVRGKSNNPILDAQSEEYYLVGMSKINSSVDFGEVKDGVQGTLEFHDLQPNAKSVEEVEIEKLKEQYSRFYILTYAIDRESRLLSSVNLWMPEFVSGNKVDMLKIDDLSAHLGNVGAVVNLEAIQELVHVPEEEFSGTAAEFDYKTIEETEKEA